VNRLAVLFAVMLALGCKGKQAQGAGASARPSGTAIASAASSAPRVDPAASASCKERRAAAMKEPALPGAPELEKNRLHLARVRGRALLWRRVPGKLSEELASRVAKLGKKEKVLDAVRSVERKLKKPEDRRAAFLREGYLYAEDVDLALAMVEQVVLAELYRDKTIFLQRGVDIYELERHGRTRWFPERYLYKEGPYQGMAAEVLLGDRIGTTREELTKTPSLAIDLRDIAEQASFDRIKPVHFSERHLVADLRYGPDVWIPALIDLDGPKATVACEELTPELEAKRRVFVEERALLLAAMQRVRGVVREMVKEEIPFDSAPDQQNGFLRRDWKRAYLQGKIKFESGGKDWWIYSLDGKPRPPQVCTDFLTDVWERASGTWYDKADVVDPFGARPKFTTHPKLLEGQINFDKVAIENRRSVAEFVEFTKKHAELFDVWELTKEERVRFEDRDQFFRFLEKRADMFRVGDMVIIHGYKHGGRPHYHSLLVTETDPITGVVTLIASNAVKPREQTLEGIMHISPQRSIKDRIRVKRPWLEIVKQAADKPL
jgi:hypothetical protein